MLFDHLLRIMLLFTLSSGLSLGLKAFADPSLPESSQDVYPLDSQSRQVSKRGRVKCPKISTISYKGTHIKYHKATKIHPAFKPKLERFEQLVIEVAREVYGRVPTKITHLGTYNCRRIGGYPDMLSEHSFGNGIDIASFHFSKLKRGEVLSSGVPSALSRAFQVSVLKHWSSKRAGGLHQRFLHLLGRRMIEHELFRVMLGPAFPGHKNHFHLDYAPYKLVAIFEEE